MSRAAAQVDVAPVRLLADDDRLETETREKLRRHGRGRAVGTIDRKDESLESSGLRKDGSQMIEVGTGQIDRAHWPGLAAARLPGGIGKDRFDGALIALGELLAFAREHLDAVVFERIVRR